MDTLKKYLKKVSLKMYPRDVLTPSGPVSRVRPRLRSRALSHIATVLWHSLTVTVPLTFRTLAHMHMCVPTLVGRSMAPNCPDRVLRRVRLLAGLACVRV